MLAELSWGLVIHQNILMFDGLNSVGRSWVYRILVGCLIVSMASSAWAIAESSRRFRQFDNSHGLNDKSSPMAIEDGESPDEQNVVFTVDGAVQKRKGHSKFNATSIPGNESITGMAYFRQSNGNDWLVCTSTNSNVYTSTNQSGTLTRISGVASWATSANNLSAFDTARDLFIFTDGSGSNPPWKWDPNGTTSDVTKVVAKLGGSPSNSNIIKYHKNHVILANTASSTISFSNLGAIETYDPGDAIEVATNDGSTVTALWEQLDGLYIGKRRSIFRMDGSSRNDFAIHKLVDGIGPINHQSVVVIDNICYFLGSDGHIYVYDGGVNVERISAKLQGTINGLQFGRMVQAVAAPVLTDQKQYWLALSASGATTHNRLLVWDIPTKSWTKFVGINANALAWAYDSNSKLQMYSGGYNGIIYKEQDTNADDGVAINAYWVSKQFHMPEIPNEKIFRRINSVLTADGNWNVTLEARSDFQGAGTTKTINVGQGTSLWSVMVWGVDVWGGRSVFESKLPFDNKIADWIQVKYSNANASEPFTMRGFEVDVESTGRP